MLNNAIKNSETINADPLTGVLLYVAVSGLGAGVFSPEFAYVAQLTTADHKMLWSNYRPSPELTRRPDTSEKNGQATRYDAIEAALRSDMIPRGSTLWITEKDRGSELMWVFGELRTGRHRDARGKPRKNAEAIKGVENLAAQLDVTIMAKVAVINEELEGIYAAKDAARAAMEDCREWRERGLD